MKMGVPLFFVNMLRQKNKRKYVVKSSLVIMVILFLMFYITGFHSSGDQNSSPFLSITYAPDNIILSVAWRSLVVPLITALDAIDVFYSKFGGSLLWGDTSSFIAFLKGTSQINFERILYQYQFGGMKSGNANQVFILEAFVNFGYLGLLCFAFILGQIVRILYRKNSLAYISVIPMIQYNLFMTGLIGNMLSNGLLLFLLFILVFDLPKMQYKKRIYGKASSISEF